MKSMVSDKLTQSHSHEAKEIAEILQVSAENGLLSGEAAERLEFYGANTLQQTATSSWLKLLLNQFSSIIIWLLGAAAIVALFTENELEAAAIFVVLLLNALIGFSIEWQAGRALDALRKATKTKARVKRDGFEQIVDTVDLVAGDIIILSSGDRVPADARVFEATNLQADESTLTGESVAVEKSESPAEREAPLAERFSMLYLGTSIVGGHGQAIVTATGINTELGRIGKLIAGTDAEKTPLEKRLEDLGKRLVYVVLFIAVVVLIAGFLRGESLWLMLEVSISLAVAAVPEALPAVTTLILALGVLRMARQNAIVRKLAAVETLGSTTVICTDKTGTLTENRMTVREYFLANGRKIEADSAHADEIFKRLLRVSVLCNEASFHPHAETEKQSIGDPTETALLNAAHRLGFEITDERKTFERLAEQSFHSTTKRMVVVVCDLKGVCSAMMKGAPAVVLSACINFIDETGKIRQLTEKKQAEFTAINDEMANQALRVLAFAEKPNPNKDYDDIEKGYTFLGFVGMNDPLRPSAFEAVREAQRAGICVVMLTGDQVSTAKAIANELNLSEGADVFALHSQDLIGTENEQLANLARQAHVFARVTPEDKLRIVEALQKTGEIVAVTGDGINDAPALKKADIGVAMGMRGTEVAKEASAIILADDNFATIVKAVEAGRTIYANIIKFVHLMFSKNLGEVLLIFTAILINLPLPLLPLQILWINLVTDLFPALALALEPPTPETKLRPPRSPKASLLSKPFLFLIVWQGAMLAVIILAAYYWAVKTYGEGAHARTIALLVLVGGQIGHLFNCRSRRHSAFKRFFANRYVFIAVGIVVLLQFSAVYFTPLANILELIRPNAFDWLIVGISTILPIIIVEISKLFSPRRRQYERTN